MRDRTRPYSQATTAFLLLFALLAMAGCAAHHEDPLAASAGNNVGLSKLRFAPSTVTVSVGETVTWTNHDPMPHDVTGKDKAWQSTGGAGGLESDATFARLFEEPGTYEYYCMLHSSGPGNGMWGTIVVEPAASA